MWILAQEKERTGSMPTAAQYGLLVKLCGSANLFSAYEAVRYLKRGRERRPQAPSILIVTLTILLLAIVLNHLLLCVYLPGQTKRSETDNLIVPQTCGCTLPQAPSFTFP